MLWSSSRGTLEDKAWSQGLIEAYGQTARMAIEAAGAVRRFKSKVLLIELPYDKEGLIRFNLSRLQQKMPHGGFLMEKMSAYAARFLCLTSKKQSGCF